MELVVLIILGLSCALYNIFGLVQSWRKAREERESKVLACVLDAAFVGLGLVLVLVGLALWANVDLRYDSPIMVVIVIIGLASLIAFLIFLGNAWLLPKIRIMLERRRERRQLEDRMREQYLAQLNPVQPQSEELHLGNEKERARAFAIPLIDAELKYYRLQLEYEGQSGLSKQIYERELAEQKKHIDENQNAFQFLDRETQKWALDQFNLGKAEIDKAYPVVFKVADEPPIEDSGVPPLVKPSKMGTRKKKAATQPTSEDRLITKRNPAGAEIPNPTSARKPRGKS